MKGAIFYASKYGSTAEYAQWISEATGLPAYNTRKSHPDPGSFDLVIIGGPILYYKLWNSKWFVKNWPKIKGKPVLFFTVSGAPAGPKLDKWLAESFPSHMRSKITHIALRGRQIPKQLSWFDRMALKFAAKHNKDPQARKEELEGFDYMDKSSIAPIVDFVEKFKGADIKPLLPYLVGIN